MQGHVFFADRLARFAADINEPRVRAIARQAGCEVTVVVRGRPGVGRGTVARALAGAGVSVSADADVHVHVVAEVVKPEDLTAISESACPTLVVLNKADLVTDPRALCAHYRALTEAPTVPMVAHLAVAQLDDAMLSALHALAVDEYVPCPVDDFAAGTQLLEALDLSGVTQAVRALRAGADGETVRRVLRRRSGVDGVVFALAPMIAEIGYGRVRSSVGALEALVATAGDDLAGQIADFLSDDDTALACMAAAVDVVEASGMTVDPGDDAAAHLRRATHWHRFRGGPVNVVHRSCGDDIVRGSLRLWRHAQRAGS